jgi:DNA-binding MarR family transcriptional regulator
MVTRAITRVYDDVLRPSGLRVTPFSILVNIARGGDGVSLAELGAVLVMDQTTLTRSLRLLEHDGMIERVSRPDARVKAMRLTAKGRRAVEAARPLCAKAPRAMLARVGPAAWGTTRRGLGRLLGATDQTRRSARSRSRRRSPAR